MSYDLFIVHPRLVLVEGMTMLTGIASDEGYEKIYTNPMKFAFGIREICRQSKQKLVVVDVDGEFVIEGFTCFARGLLEIEKQAGELAEMTKFYLDFETRVISDQLFRSADFNRCA